MVVWWQSPPQEVACSWKPSLFILVLGDSLSHSELLGLPRAPWPEQLCQISHLYGNHAGLEIPPPCETSFTPSDGTSRDQWEPTKLHCKASEN